MTPSGHEGLPDAASSNSRLADGSIRARCDGITDLVFTTFGPKEGGVHELALNYIAAKHMLRVDC